MKPVNRFFLAIMIALLAFRANSQLIVVDTLTFSLNDVTFDTIGSYVRPALLGCHYTDVVGAPNMPYLVKDYLLPHNAEITDLTILDSNHFTLQGTYLVYPTQTPIILDGRPAPPFVEPDPAYYNSGSRYVGDVAEIQAESSTYGYGLVRVKVFPLQYIPSTQQLVLFTSIVLRIEYQITGTDSLIGKMSTHQYQGMLDYLSKTVENFYDIENYGSVCKEIIDYEGSRPLNLYFLPGAGGDHVEYLIITNDELKPYFEPLAAWKMSKGIPALVVSTSQIEPYYAGCDLAEKIFNYLKDVYNNWGEIYILLGGDAEIVPSRLATLTDGKYFVTDLYFSDVHDEDDQNYDWNYDNDNDFCDEDGHLDLIPDNYIGRAPVKSAEQTKSFVDKILYYEQRTFNDYHNITLIGAYTGDCGVKEPENVIPMYQLNNAYNSIPGNTFSTIRIYDDPAIWNGDYPLSQENVLKSFGGTDNPFEPQHIIAHIDHSGFYCIGTSENCHQEKLTIAELDDILYESGNIYKIMYTGGCQPNDFTRDCFSEYFINGTGSEVENQGIGIGFIGNIGDGHNAPNQVKTFFQYLYDEPMHNLGKIFNETRKADFTSEQVRNLNFLGDPELPVWTDDLDELSITTNLDPLVIGENQLEVTVGGLGSDEAVVCIYKENEVYGVQTTETYGSDHKAVFQHCKPDTGGDLYITATSPNHLYSQEIIDVDSKNPPEVHLFITNNANMPFLTRGENTFSIDLKNNGKSTATDINSTLSSLSEYVDINPWLPPSSDFEDICSLCTKTSINQYAITVNDDVPDLSFIKLKLTIHCAQGDFFEEFFLQVKIPQLEFRGNKIIWTTENEDMFIEQGGEVVRFKVELINKGSETVHISNAQIFEPQEYDYIEDIIIGAVSFRDIAPLDTAWSTGYFEVEMEEDLEPYGTFPLLLQIIDGSGQLNEYEIKINNTIVPEDFFFNSSINSITLNWIPQNNYLSGYNIYRLDASDLGPGVNIEDSTLYTRLNLLVNKFSTFTDYNVEPEKEYYYKVACYSNDGLPQGPFSPAFKAWTANLPLEPWPVFLPENGHRSEGSPILYNAIPGDNGDNPELEIFFPIDDRNNENCNKSALYAFNSDGTELYDIDNNADTYAGFVNFENTGMKATPVVGEMNNDDSYGEVTFATTYDTHDPPSENVKQLQLYSAGDVNNNDPDNLWHIQLNQAVRTALVAAKLSNTPNEDVKIIAAEMWKGDIDVRNSSNGSSYASWPIDVPRTITLDPDDKDEVITFGVPVAADLDGDMSKEIIVGCRANMTIEHNGIYIFNSDGSYYGEEDEPFYIPTNTTNLSGLDCCPVVAEIDQTENPEIIIIASYFLNNVITAKVLILNHDGTLVNNWDENQQGHIIDIPVNDTASHPAITAADLDHDGIVEIITAAAGKIYAWKSTGAAFNDHFPILVEGLECQSMAPLVANVDSDYENEIIITSKQGGAGFIYAFNTDGTAVPRWPLTVNGIYATPAIGDVNHDGLNEIVAVYDCYANVWKTQGETGHDEWPLYRLNSFNNAVYEQPVCNYDPNNPVEISQADEYWDGYRVMESDIVVKHSRTLTIAGRVAMPDDARIIVERGGKLNVEGGVITSACGGLWQGIEVWGYSDKSQYDPTFIPGTVELYENAVIENARAGISTIKTRIGPQGLNYTGGIILCKDALFLNNIDGIKFYPYRNFDPNRPEVELENCSYIKNCKFETNGPLAEFESYPDAFIFMSGISGILLRGNQFINSTGERFTWDQRGTGILSYNSTYRVDELCLNNTIPCSQSKPNEFSNLHYGIRAFSTLESSRAISVLHSDFYYTKNGIFISYMNNALIAMNNFYIARTATLEEPISYGLYVEYSTGYAIEENYFENKYPVGHGNIGLYISNSGPKPNEVYKNDFKGLDYGIVAYGKNRSEEGAGLCLKCNNFETCDNDIQVIPEKDENGNWIPGREEGIAAMQGAGGSDTAPAGNTFTDVDEFPQTFNYFNHENCNLIDYHHHQTYPDPLIIEPSPRSEEMVHLSPENAQYLNKEHACPSNFGGGSLNINFERSIIISEDEQVIVYSDSIQELKDGGDTYGLNLDVYTSTTEEAYEIRQQLLDESPYLSDTVMKSAILKENVLPNAMIRDILVANPQSAKSSEILIEVNERMDPMPDEMLEEILEGKTYKGNLELMQDKLAHHETKKYASLRKLESYYKQDTLDYQGSQDSLISLWECEADPSAQYRLAFLHLHKGDSLNCFSTLNSIPQLNNLSTEELIEFDRYTDLINLMWPLTNYDAILDSLTINQLFTLAQSESVPGTIARNFLVANAFMDYFEPIYLSDELKSTSIVPEKPKKNADKNHRLKVFPNPATNYIIASYDITDLEGDVTLKICTTEGKPVYQQKIKGIKNQVIIFTGNFSSSNYFLQLLDGNHAIESINFIISK